MTNSRRGRDSPAAHFCRARSAGGKPRRMQQVRLRDNPLGFIRARPSIRHTA